MTGTPADAAPLEDGAGSVLEPVPIPVAGELTVRHPVVTHQGAADFGAYFTQTYAGTEGPQELLKYDVNRARAYVTVTGTGPVYVGSYAGVNAMRNGAVQGQAPAYILATGITLPITHKQQVWLAPDGTHSATVSVAIERWETP